jgi:hypothetical protein
VGRNPCPGPDNLACCANHAWSPPDQVAAGPADLWGNEDGARQQNAPGGAEGRTGAFRHPESMGVASLGFFRKFTKLAALAACAPIPFDGAQLVPHMCAIVCGTPMRSTSEIRRRPAAWYWSQMQCGQEREKCPLAFLSADPPLVGVGFCTKALRSIPLSCLRCFSSLRDTQLL